MLKQGETDNGQDKKDAASSGRPGYINCIRCEHFIVTWQAGMPRGCKVFGFKGPLMPSLTVFNVTGKKCPAFKLKQRK